MFFYVLLALLIFITSFCYSFGQNKYFALNMKILCFLLLFIPAALRMNIGTDYVNYLKIFQKLKATGYIKQEIGWKILNLFVYKTDLHYQYIFVISSFLIYLGIIKTDKKDFWIATFVYFLYLYATSYNAVRNAISIALFWYSYVCLLRNKKVIGYVYILIGAMFHSSALLYLPIYFFMGRIKFSKKTTLLIALVMYILIRYFHIADYIMNSSIMEALRYAKYLSNAMYNSSTDYNSGLGILIRHCYIFFIYCLIDEKKCGKVEFSAISILFLAILVSDTLMTQIYIFYRLKDCFLVAYMAIFACLFRYRSRNAIIKISKFCALMYPVLFIFLHNLKNNYNEIIPYTHIF